ncbi:MAG TPA: R3H domain-containing nucleic acid-binding protein [Candidatus Paceibacterota bacterium]|nr:R3H domain-containing nucleic acid-binding protein [Candidatus Paceibacterota bacterium]
MEPSVETTLKDLLQALGLPHSGIERSELAGQVIFTIDVGDDRVLGNNPDLVHALDHLVKKIVEKQAGGKTSDADSEEGRTMFLIDINGQRIKHIKDLQTKAIMMAERARSFQYDVELTPMSSYERLIIHTTLQDAPNVKTESQGEGRNRRVVIKYSAG